MSDGSPRGLANLLQEVADEMIADGLSPPVPPDRDDETIDRELWRRVGIRLDGAGDGAASSGD